MLHDRSVRRERAYLPSDLGRPPEEGRSRSRNYLVEKADPRRGNTDHVRELEAEIERRRADGTLIEQSAEMDRDVGPVPPASADIPSEPLDIERHSIEHSTVEHEDIERSSMSEDQGVTVVSDGPKAEASKGKVTKRVKKVTAKTVAAFKKANKARLRKKGASAARLKKAAKGSKTPKQPPRSKRDDVPCCVNYRRPLLKRIDAAAKKEGLSRSRFMAETMAKRVGFKAAS